MRSLSGTLLTAQRANSIDALIKVALTDASNYTYDRDRILDIDHPEEPYSQKAEVLLDNSDGVLTPLDLKGYKAVLSYGAVSGAGDEYSACAPLWVTGQRFDSAQGILVCELELKGIPDLMAEDHASENYIPDEDDTKTVKTLLTQIIGATLPCFNHCTAYQIVWDGEDSLINSYKPKDSFRIYTGGSRLAQVRRLLDYTKCVMRVQNDGKVHILVPTISGTSYNYEYSLTTGHTFFSKAYRNRLVIPNYVVVKSNDDDDPQYSGYAQDAGSYALLPKRYYKQMRLESHAQATSMAEAILSKYQLWAEGGAADVPINCGAEVFDYVKVTDTRQNDARTGNIGHLNRHYSAGRGTAKTQWNLTFSFGNWLSVRKTLQDLETYSDEGAYFSRLYAKDAYIEHIQADSLDMIWLDPEGNIDLSQIGDDLDSLPDGDLYARVKSLHMDAGQIKLDEHVLYKTGYDPNTKRRNFTSTPTTPYDLGDMWTSGTVLKRCTTARATGAYVAGDWTQVSIDEIGDGSIYRRAKSAALTASGLVILDELYIDTEAGDYDLVARADISAHHIKLSSTLKDGEWYNESGVEIDATHGINIYGAANALTTRATKTGTIQCYVGADGAIYAGGGNVIINADGIELASTTVLKLSYGGANDAWIFVNATGYLQITHASGKALSTVNILAVDMIIDDKIECKRIYPTADETAGYDCGAVGDAWKQVVGEVLADDDGNLGEYQHYDDIDIIKKLKYKDHKKKTSKRHIDSAGLPQEIIMKSPDGEKSYINVGELQGFMLGTFKQMIEKIEVLEEKVSVLMG